MTWSDGSRRQRLFPHEVNRISEPTYALCLQSANCEPVDADIMQISISEFLRRAAKAELERVAQTEEFKDLVEEDAERHEKKRELVGSLKA